MTLDEAAFGPGGLEGLKVERRERITALNYRRQGNETFLGMRTIDQEGRLTGAGRVEAFLDRPMIGSRRIKGEKEIEQGLDRTDASLFGKLESAAEHLDRAAERLENTGQGPTLIPPNAEAPATSRLASANCW